MEISPLLDVELVKIFSHHVGCHFIWIMVSFAILNLFSFMKTHSLIFNFSAFVMVFSWMYLIFCWGFDPLELCFVKGDNYVSIYTDLHTDIQFHQYHSLSMASFLQCVFLALLKIRCVDLCLNLLFDPIDHYICVLSQYHAVFFTLVL